MKIIIRLAFFVTLACCSIASHAISFKNLDKDYALKASSTDVVIVIGITPRYRVAIARGSIIDGKVMVGRGASINAFPEHGYIVGKLKPATAPSEYHIQMVLPEGIGAFVPAYTLCGDDNAISFQAPTGKVLYLGDIAFENRAKSLRPRLSYNFESAKKFMGNEYPKLAPHMEQAQFTSIPLYNSMCPPEDAPETRKAGANPP